MSICVSRLDGVHRLAGDAGLVEIGNRWLAHLEARQFSPATVRGYAYDVVCLARFLDDVEISWDELVPSDVFDWLEWQARPRPVSGRVVRLGEGRGAAPATMNRRVAAARGLFEYAVMCGAVAVNPVPAPRRSTGLRARRRGLLGHVQARRPAAPARLVRQDRPLPESLEAGDVEVFLADLNTHRDRAITLAMLLGGPTTGQAMSEAGLRKIFRVHRARTGAVRVRPHRLRHTFGTDLAAAGIDLLVLRELMGHAHVETTAAYVHLGPETIAAEWARARQAER
jgi:site-specific recombinase XerD